MVYGVSEDITNGCGKSRREKKNICNDNCWLVWLLEPDRIPPNCTVEARRFRLNFLIITTTRYGHNKADEGEITASTRASSNLACYYSKSFERFNGLWKGERYQKVVTTTARVNGRQSWLFDVVKSSSCSPTQVCLSHCPTTISIDRPDSPSTFYHSIITSFSSSLYSLLNTRSLELLHLLLKINRFNLYLKLLSSRSSFAKDLSLVRE